MRLCMFHPNDNPMDRGWVGRVDGDRVLHLAAQTLQSLFLGGGSAREHGEYARADVTLLVPVQVPPTVRVFDAEDDFAFANATAIGGPGLEVASNGGILLLVPRLAAVIGAEGAIAGFSLFAEWRRDGGTPPKDRDFALVLGPVVATPDELDPSATTIVVRADGSDVARIDPSAFDWTAAVALAAQGTTLRPGDVLAGPGDPISGLTGGVELEADGIGVLVQSIA